jgi:hypothetical protein
VRKSNPGALSREARRLLQGLGAEGSYALPDPVEKGQVILRASRNGVSVAGGVFAEGVLDELVRRDLVAAERLGAKRIFNLSRAGRARLKREEAPADLAYLAQHRDLVGGKVDLDGRKAAVTLDAAESPLDWLRRRKDRNGAPYVDEPSYEAGERLRRDLTLAAMLPRVTANWDAAVADRGRGGVDPAGASDTAIAARQRATRALAAVGPDLADLLLDLCGFLKGLERIERERGWPARSGKIMARLALARLADHYGLQRSAQGPARSRGIQAWRALVLDGERAD